MNYIRHLSAFFEKIYSDDRLQQGHVCLYMALFQFWNLNRFENPFPVNRTEVLKLSKVKSLNSYHKYLHELDEFGYIQYIPSFNPMKSSLINMHNLFVEDDSSLAEDSISNPARRKIDTGVNTGDHTTLDAKSIQVLYQARLKNDTGVDIGLASLIKQYKHINNKREREEKSHTQNLNNEIDSEKQQDLFKVETVTPEKPKRKKVAPKKEKVNIPSNLDEVLSFFKQEQYPELEARKFFNHFQSNGWKVGGKAPMKDWHAAANKWMLNNQNFSARSKPGSKYLNNNKNYGEPL